MNHSRWQRGEAKAATASATSSGAPIRQSGIWAISFWRASPWTCCWVMSVSIKPGGHSVTVIPRDQLSGRSRHAGKSCLSRRVADLTGVAHLTNGGRPG